MTGKGFNEGTRTKGKFVPEQHTDYIFSTVAEEWGFLGSSLVVLMFVALIGRIIFLAEQQKSQFNRAYGYGVASILFVHFLVNIGMVMGLIPTVGIPLPFFSYGGSGLLGFTILIFIFLKLDANRLNVW
jgi:rod shape determining protein RodA